MTTGRAGTDEPRFRHAGVADAEHLAAMNAQLIRDEGHRNTVTLAELTDRMCGWLLGPYEAVVFEVGAVVAGYALYRLDPEHAYLRHLYVAPALRRQGVARRALRWMWRHAWAAAPRLRIDVLVGNEAGIAFWRSVGFRDYCLTMEAEAPPGG